MSIWRRNARNELGSFLQFPVEDQFSECIILALLHSELDHWTLQYQPTPFLCQGPRKYPPKSTCRNRAVICSTEADRTIHMQTRAHAMKKSSRSFLYYSQVREDNCVSEMQTIALAEQDIQLFKLLSVKTSSSWVQKRYFSKNLQVRITQYLSVSAWVCVCVGPGCSSFESEGLTFL